MAIYNMQNDVFRNEIIKAMVVGFIAEDTADVDAPTAIAVADETLFKCIGSIARAHTLAAGTVDGATVRVVKRAGAGVDTVTPAAFTDGTSIALSAIGDMVTFEWDATAASWDLKFATNLLTGAAIAVTP